MCIVAYKPVNTAPLTKAILKNCFTNNSDGAGIMTRENKDSKILIKKGFMTFKKFYTTYREMVTKKNEAVIHCRIATSGNTNEHNTHPFPISEKDEDLKALEIETDFAMAHNGIISDFSIKENELSDTQMFIKNVVAKKIVRESFHDITIKNLLILATSGGRCAYMKTGEDVFLTGPWDSDFDHKFSNNGYKYTYTYTRFPQYYRNGYSDASYYDDEFYDIYKYPKPKTKVIETLPKTMPAVITNKLIYCPSCAYATIKGSGEWIKFDDKNYIQIYTCAQCQETFDEDGILSL